MESSSENSFTWTDTSSDSIDSPSINVEDATFDNLEPNNTKKLSSCNGTKIKFENGYINENKNSPQKKMEPSSDNDGIKRVKKIKIIKPDGLDKVRQDSASYDESFLNIKVKQEDINTVKKKKKKQHINKNQSDSDSNVVKIKLKEASPDFYMLSHDFEDDSKTNRKKKKKKLKRKSDSEESRDVNYKMGHEDSVPNKSKRRISETSFIENMFQTDTSNEISAIQCDDHNLHTLSFNSERTIEKENKKVTDNLYKSTLQSTLINQCYSPLAEHRKPRLSDRIRFEDDSDHELSHGYQDEGNKTLSKLQKFLNTCTNMKLISQDLHNSADLTVDDELWTVQCPKDIDIHAFSGIDLNMHGKRKIKVDGQTFDCSFESEQSDTVALMTTAHGKYEINNLPLNGIIKFRKRIPKAHFRDDNIIVNNQTNFIPLPETKCRHPLFGFHYKKALKVPVAIALRLNQQNGEEKIEGACKRKKKKHKKDKNCLEFEEIDSKSQVKIVLEQDPILNITEKRIKKRQRTEDEYPTPKRPKKLKHDPESADAWESEKAIEQNLFNY